jgi:hypothetical protein
MRERRAEYYNPDHWTEDRLPETQATEPVVGVRPDDVLRFCDWLHTRDIWHGREIRYVQFRIPDMTEVDSAHLEGEDSAVYWISSNWKMVAYSQQPRLSAYELEAEHVTKQLQEDLDRLVRLREADEKRTAPRHKSGETPGAIPMPYGQLDPRFKARTEAKERELVAQLDKDSESLLLLKDYERLGVLFALDFHLVADCSAALYTGQRDDQRKIWSWLPLKTTYNLEDFDLGARLVNALQYLDGEPRSSLPKGSSVVFLDNAARALTMLRWREWAGKRYEKPLSPGKAYGFLRWYARLCIASLGTIAKYQMTSTAKGTQTVRKEVIRVGEDLIASLVFLEERVQRERHTLEGIRLVETMMTS